MLKKFSLPELNNVKQLLLPSVAIYIVLVFILPKTGHPWDTSCWGRWATIMKSGGIVEAYSPESPVNYLPLYLYVLKVYGWIFNTDQIYKHLYLLKAFTLLFDIGSILLLCSLVKLESKRFKYFVIGLFNIGFLYNSLIWNQVDGILSFFIFSSFYFAIQQRITLSYFLFLLALNFKLQGIIFLPLLGLMWLPQIRIKLLMRLSAITILTQPIIILPFIINGNVKNIVGVVLGSVDYFQSISMNAFNLWHLLLDGDLIKMRDDLTFIGVFTYKQTGLFLFLVSSALVCIPLYIRTIRKMRKKEPIIPDMKLMLLSFALITCFFFYFNTQMHERYMHPLIIFSTTMALLYKHWTQWVIFSLAYVLSLESIVMFLDLPNYHTLIFHPDFIASLYGIGILQLMYLWYHTGTFKKET